MSEPEETGIVKAEDKAPVAQPRYEESWDWVINTYRKHCLAQVSEELDGFLGENRSKDRWMQQDILDLNPVEFRQSLQEQVFPSPRVFNEDLLEVPRDKIVLEAGHGMGKTLFLKLYQERLLKEPPHAHFPLVVYFEVGQLPPGTGFDLIWDRVLRQIYETVLLEIEEDEELVLDESILFQTVEALMRANKVCFLLDGLDLLPIEDRFRVYFRLMVEDNALGSNFIILAARSLDFGSFATDSVIKKSEEASFRIHLDSISNKVRKKYLLEEETRTLDSLYLFAPELSITPILIRMIRTVIDLEKIQDVRTRTDIYQIYFQSVFEKLGEERGGQWAQDCFDKICSVSFNLFEQDWVQRHEDIETSLDKDCWKETEETQQLFLKDASLIPEMADVVHQSDKRWQYCHPSYQEYMAARELAKRDDWQDIVRQRCRNVKWEGLLIFFAGLTPDWNEELFEILLEEGALFPAGNALSEATQLSEPLELLVKQLLKYQCKESLPQFGAFRLVNCQNVLSAFDWDDLKKRILRLLERKNRDSRILFGVFELLLRHYGINIVDVIDTQDFTAVFKLEELQSFFAEVKDKEQVNRSVVKKWGERVTIPAGKFTYQQETDEEDKVDLKEYSIMKYPVTNALYREFDPNYRLLFPLYSSQDDDPVIGVNYYESTVFALWMGARLPTEKEWEKAARGPNGNEYPWGDPIGYQSGYTNTADFVRGRTNPVEEFEHGLSAYGCFDMAGNVWEWCVQLYASKFTTQKMVRGGSWLNYMVHAKCTFRNSFDPSERHLTSGLRCVSLPLTDIESEDDEDDEEF